MELMQVKSLLHKTEFGELVVDGMGCSEPVLSRKQGVLIDNFFIYLADKKSRKSHRSYRKNRPLRGSG